MSKKLLAIASCRVSSIEQVQSNSLNRQQAAVLKAAKALGVIIPEDGWWSGSVSSKRGSNVHRKDLKQMVDRCKKDKRIKYIIVDEPDRFMRSIDEAAYFEVTFRQLGVKVWYASDPELNKGDLSSKLLKFTKYLSAEGSNEERQRKSVAGLSKALAEGKYPFSPKPGYRRGYVRGVQEIDPLRGPVLQGILVRIASRLVTPSKALIELNSSRFTEGRALYKMDKFRKIVTDPFYAGIVESNKQVVVRNENGLHEPLITKEQHSELVLIMSGKAKNQSGPRKNGNPKYPLSNLVNCTDCTDATNGRIVGFDSHNGKNKTRIYEKYRCRACRRYITKDKLHDEVQQRFNSIRIAAENHGFFIEALEIVWKQNKDQKQQEAIRIKQNIKAIQGVISNQVEAATEPANASIKTEILASITKKKDEIASLEERLYQLDSDARDDKGLFLEFAFAFADNASSEFFEMSREYRIQCKQLIFPGGFYLNADKKVYTPEISPLYTLTTNKKDLSDKEKSLLVRVQRL